MSKSQDCTYKSLFIIDDDIEDQEILIEAIKLVDPSIVCYTATSGDDAFKQFDLSVIVLPDLIFLDLNMPKSNGKQVLKKIKEVGSLKRIPVIMYSTSFAPRDLEEIKEFGAAHHLLKPSRFELLCTAVKEILSVDWYYNTRDEIN